MPLQVFILVMIKKIGNVRVGFCNLLVTTCATDANLRKFVSLTVPLQIEFRQASQSYYLTFTSLG